MPRYHQEASSSHGLQMLPSVDRNDGVAAIFSFYVQRYDQTVLILCLPQRRQLGNHMTGWCGFIAVAKTKLLPLPTVKRYHSSTVCHWLHAQRIAN